MGASHCVSSTRISRRPSHLSEGSCKYRSNRERSLDLCSGSDIRSRSGPHLYLVQGLLSPVSFERQIGTMPPKRARSGKAKLHASKADLHEEAVAHDAADDDSWVESAFASRYSSQAVPKDRFPEKAMPANVAYQLIKDMRQLDSNPRLNLASFVTTWMEPEAISLITESLNVNYVDMEQYPSSTDIQNRVVAILANLYHGEVKDGIGTGTATIGSSEAIMLAGLAMKKAWVERRKKAGKPYDKPNLIMGYNVQVCWEKFTRYFDVEEKFVEMEEDCYVLTPEKAIALVDENTIGICAILGSTYTGEFEDVEGLDREVEKLNKKTGWEVPIHVDAASGGFVAPFVFPHLKWDFRLKNVVSINVSGHKYGLVYPGIGWVLWKSEKYLPEAIVFHVNYLGSDQPTMTLNFSRGASMIIAQYYQFLRLGFDGYKKIMSNLLMVSRRLRLGIEETGHFKILSDDEHSLPLVAFSLKKEIVTEGGKKHPRTFNEFDIADKLKMRGWVLPAYHMAPNAKHVMLLRAVVREDLSMSMVDELIKDLHRAIEWLDHHYTFSDTEMDTLVSRMHVKKQKRIPSTPSNEEDPDNEKMNGVC
ncbi:hypothetical protein WJX74_004401 [Apatococcus lobatus]|uniref:Glutamate decarboxylase n=1 Tax=Apatococcus lobatus TaxID=904363 RepID=A0AAW1RJU7_9CHLO